MRVAAAALVALALTAAAAPWLPLRDPASQPDGVVLRNLPPGAVAWTVRLADLGFLHAARNAATTTESKSAVPTAGILKAIAAGLRGTTGRASEGRSAGFCIISRIENLLVDLGRVACPACPERS